jgi:hypothetical protein|tara:strand:+ start:862 stop:1092 length:231 start_codon:yes stop_codon:yes gene_type:complete
VADSKAHLKECYRLLWIVKGHINWPEEDALAMYNSYFKRVWYNEESYIAQEGFAEAWEEREQEEINKVAVLGGHFD